MVFLGFNPNKNNNLFKQLKLIKKISVKILDVKDYSKVNNLIIKTKPQIIFHLAAQPLIYDSYLKPYETYMYIISIGTLNILEAVRNQLKKYSKSISLRY